MHSKVEYIAAHMEFRPSMENGRSSGQPFRLLKTKKCTIPEGKEELFENFRSNIHISYLVTENKLAAVICIEDPLREEAEEIILALEKGPSKIAMMTGDSERTAHAIAERVGVDEYYSEVLPEDKAAFWEKKRLPEEKSS